MHVNTLKNTLFLDIETVASTYSFNDLRKNYKHLWKKQVEQSYRDATETLEELWNKKAGLHPEFAKIITVSLGLVDINDSKLHAKIVSFRGEESKILSEITKAFNLADPSNPNVFRFNYLVAHNGKNFDFPFLFKRYLINKLQVPSLLNNIGKKPWECPYVDTMDLWTAGGRGYPSLELICHSLGIKVDQLLDGCDINDTYYNKKDLDSIVKYCSQDVETLIRVYLKINQFNDELVKVDFIQK